MTNKIGNKLIDATIEWLENGGHAADHVFDMDMVYHEESCKTVCCMLGYMAHIDNNLHEDAPLSGITASEFFYNRTGENVAVAAMAERLGIEYRTAENLFHPKEFSLGYVTPEIAAKTLRGLRATGEVVWDIYPDRAERGMAISKT